MASGPDGLDKPRRNRLTLKTAVAALALANATPAAHAQDASPTVEIASPARAAEQATEPLQAEVDSIFKWHQKQLAYIRALYGGDDPILKSYEEIAERTKSALHDPRYLRGVAMIKARGGSLYQFIGADPSFLTNTDVLAARLARIPKELEQILLLTPFDVNGERDYNYQRPGLIELARGMTTSYGTIDIDRLNQILDIEQSTPGFSERIVQLAKRAISRLSPIDILSLIQRGSIEPKSLMDDAFVNGFVTLLAAHVDVSDLVRDTPEGKARLPDLVRDPVFVSLVVKLKELKVPLWDIRDISPDVYANPNFLQNLQAMQHGVDFSMSLRLADKALAREGLGEIVSAMPKDVRGDVYYWASKFANANDERTWLKALKLVRTHSFDPNMTDVIFALDAVRLEDEMFMALLERNVRALQSKDFNKYKPLFEAERQYVANKIGVNPRQMTIQQYEQAVANPDSTALSRDIMLRYEDRIYTGPVLRMNQSHNAEPSARLRELKDVDAAGVFKIILSGGADAYLSTFRLLYNGNGYAGAESKYAFIPRVKAEYGSLTAFFKAVNPDRKKFGEFLGYLSQNNIVDQFLADIGPAEAQHAVLRGYLFDASLGISDAQAVTLSDLTHTTKSDEIRGFLLGELRSLSDDSTHNKRLPRVAALLIADYYNDKIEAPDWAKESIREYGKYFPDVRELPEASVFRQEGSVSRNTQLHLFYDDREKGGPENTWDGHASFRSFVASLGGSVEWDAKGTIRRITVGKNYQLTDKGDYVIIRQADKRAKREIVMFANKPDRSDEVVAKIGSEIVKTERPQIGSHRGHSYHAEKSIRVFDQNMSMINLGSCGGANNIADILDKIPGAQIMATRGVGTMLVNDVVIPSFNAALLREGSIVWAKFGMQMSAEFKKRGGLAQERWGSYQMPDKNRIAHLTAALKALGK